jgi:hypothetical protein
VVSPSHLLGTYSQQSFARAKSRAPFSRYTFFENIGRSSASQLRKVRNKGLSTAHDLPRQAKKQAQRPTRHAQRSQKAAKAHGLLTPPFNSPSLLFNVFFDSSGDLQHRFLGVVEYSLVPFLPKIPVCVDHQTIELPPFFLCDLCCNLLPPRAEVNMVMCRLYEVAIKVLLG